MTYAVVSKPANYRARITRVDTTNPLICLHEIFLHNLVCIHWERNQNALESTLSCKCCGDLAVDEMGVWRLKRLQENCDESVG